MTRMQRTVARRMASARAEVPDFLAEVEIDMSAIKSCRNARKDEGGTAPSYNDFLIRTCALALRRVPKLNSSFSSEGFVYHDRVNIGVAVATTDGLVVPTVFDADRKSVDRISIEVKELASKVRDASIRAAELTDQTFTVSNLGMHGLTRFAAIVSPPQAGILAVGAIRDAVVAYEGAPSVRPVMSVVLSCDHRIVYGADAATFLHAVREGLEEPRLLAGTNDFSTEPRP